MRATMLRVDVVGGGVFTRPRAPRRNVDLCSSRRERVASRCAAHISPTGRTVGGVQRHRGAAQGGAAVRIRSTSVEGAAGSTSSQYPRS